MTAPILRSSRRTAACGGQPRAQRSTHSWPCSRRARQQRFAPHLLLLPLRRPCRHLCLSPQFSDLKQPAVRCQGLEEVRSRKAKTTAGWAHGRLRPKTVGAVPLH